MPVVPKYQKTSKNKLQHKKGATHSAVRPYIGFRPNIGFRPRKTDLTSLTNKLEKAKVVQEKAVGADVSNNPAADYCNASEMSTCISENLVTINNPPDKRPKAGPQTTPGNHAGNDTCSALSASSSKKTYRLWQCANCRTVNEVHHTVCECCKLSQGKMANRSYLCDFCQLMIFIPLKMEFEDLCCPRCKKVCESAL